MISFQGKAGYQNDQFTGPFFFARCIYSQLCDSKMSTLKERLEEYDELKFGFRYFDDKKRKAVADWLQQELGNH